MCSKEQNGVTWWKLRSLVSLNNTTAYIGRYGAPWNGPIWVEVQTHWILLFCKSFKNPHCLSYWLPPFIVSLVFVFLKFYCIEVGWLNSCFDYKLRSVLWYVRFIQSKPKMEQQAFRELLLHEKQSFYSFRQLMLYLKKTRISIANFFFMIKWESYKQSCDPKYSAWERWKKPEC
jgi:hypothetical protein